jgi:Mg2+-importing ATPase
MLILRTRRPALRSRPSAALLWSSVGVAVVTLAVPWMPFASRLGMAPPSAAILAAVGAIVVVYALVSERLKLALGRVSSDAARR